MKQYLLILTAALLTALAASAQDTDLSGILAATRRASAENSQAAAQTLGNIAADMRTVNRTTAANLSGIASAMRASSAGSTEGQAQTAGFYSPDVTYSTYGTDARPDIANNATASSNPYLMADYSAGGIYAVPAGRKYINTGYSTGGQFSPISGRVTSGFGYRPSFGRMHRGIDISLNVGDTVRAAFDGKVVLVANNPGGYGRYVKVQHGNGMETLYGHLSAPLVVHGQQLRAGQPLGLGGATGNATGPHLHFETRVNGTAVDPSTYFDFSRPGGATPRKSGAAPIRDNGKKTTTPAKSKGKTETAEPKPSRVRLKTETVASAAGNNAGKQPRTATYQVRRGDTMAKIARDHGMTVGELCRINKMSPYTPMYKGKVIRLK